MKTVLSTVLFTLAVLLNSIDSGSASNYVHAQHPLEFHEIKYFELPNGKLLSLNPNRFNQLERDNDYIYGVTIGSLVHPICNGNGQRILVDRHINRNILMTPELAHRYGFDRTIWVLNSISATSSPALPKRRRTHM